MSTISLDHVADVLRHDLLNMGCSRVILLGSEKDMAPGGLRTALAKRGLQVLVPPEGTRAWIAGLSRCPDESGERTACGDARVSQEEIDQLRALLLDGAEHGVQAIVATSQPLADCVRACELPIPTIVPSSMMVNP